MNDHNLETLDLDLLTAVSGGDGWSDYKNRIKQDWKDTTNRYNKALYYNGVNGHTDTGKFLDNYGGMLYDGAKTAIDTVPILGPAITNRL
jgi:hypothetical protein